MRKRVWLVVILTLLLLALLALSSFLIWASFFGGRIKVKTTPVKRGNLAQKVAASGEIIPSLELNVVSEVTAKIVEVLVAPGSTVKTGQLIIRLDSTQLDLELREAQANLSQAQAKRDKINRFLNQGTPPPESSPEEKESYTPEDLRIAQAEVEEAQAQVKLAQGRVQATKIKAPLVGTVTDLKAVVGGMASPAEPLAVISDPAQMYFQAAVDEVDIVQVKEGQEAEVILDAYPDAVLSGEVIEVGKTPTSTKTQETVYPVKIRITLSKGAELRSGMKGDSQIILKLKKDVLIVPTIAVTTRHKQTQVFVVKKGRIEERIIKVGLSAGDIYEVEEGLREGEKVVITKVTHLKGGEKVRVE